MTPPSAPSPAPHSLRLDEPGGGAGARRTRYALQSAALVFAATAVCVLGVLLASRFPARLDATATREHRLSARTLEILGSLAGEYEVIVAANFAALDPGAAARTRGVLENFARQSPRVTATVIDAGGADGPSRLDGVLARVAGRFEAQTAAQRAGVGAARAALGEATAALGRLSDGLLAAQQGVRDDDPGARQLREFFGSAAAGCRLGGEELTKASGAAGEAAGRTVAGTAVPALDDAVAALRRPLSDVLTRLSQANDGLDVIGRASGGQVPESARGAAGPLAAAAADLRNRIGGVASALDALPRTPVGSVARLLGRSSAAVIVGPPGSGGAARRGGVTSIDLGSIFPARPPEGAGGAAPVDLRARAEELIAGGLASLSRADAPIVVFVHGRGVRIAPAFVPVAPIVDRLSLRGIDFAEWATALDDEPPGLNALDPSGKRPVVWVVISMAPGRAEEGAALARLARGAANLVRDGRGVLLCAVPSSLPGIGQKDPMVEFLSPLGVEVDTGRPLLSAVTGPRGRTVFSALALADPMASHPVSGAVRGQAMVMDWAVPVRSAGAGAGAVTPVVRVGAGNVAGEVWAESDWLSFLQTPEEQRPLLIDPPSPGGPRDDAAGPWTVAAAVERTVAGARQRVMVVGNNRWLDARVLGEMTDAGGRAMPAWPGNLELLDASVSWLAGQDGMIAASPAAQAVPVVPPLSEGALSAVRLGLIGGLPLLILLIGAGWRLWRG